jgi:hypothetical protein
MEEEVDAGLAVWMVPMSQWCSRAQKYCDPSSADVLGRLAPQHPAAARDPPADDQPTSELYPVWLNDSQPLREQA